ncbi:MAG TPA: ABC transporter substrate-binding protein [Gaiellaceae bacterium]|jgi:peptide/nickel transport system substrate-binding protein|nr:ABC transporter substrate-binding protein [Gaiellaceae bacterium]
MGKRRRLLLAGVSVAAVAAAAALAASAYGGSKANNGIIVDGTTDTVVNIDPANQYDYGSFTVDLLIFQGLYGFPNGAKLKPELATGCSHSKNLKTWTCQLRHGVKFSDGNPMTSADVKYSFDRVQKIKGDQGIWTLLSDLKSTTTKGKYAVVFHLKEPFSIWPYILSTNAGYVVEKSKFPANKILSNTDTADMIGTGPYVLSKYTPGQQAVFTPNKNYWGPKPKNQGVIINYFSKSSTMKLALEQGNLDMAFETFTPTEISSMKKEKALVVHSAPGVVIRYLVFNVKRPPFNNINVRKAIAYLFPRQTIASRVYHNTVTPLYSMVPKGLPGATQAYKSIYGAKPNLAKAKAAMKAAHVKTPMPIQLWWTPSHYGDASADEYVEIQRALNASKLFKVTLKSAEWAQYSGALGKTYGAFQLGWFPDYPDADDYTVSFYQPNSFYNNGYNNKAMDKLIAKERAARTTKLRMKYIRGMQTVAAKTLPTIPYWQGNMIAVGRSNVKGIPSTLDATYYMRFWLISKS